MNRKIMLAALAFDLIYAQAQAVEVTGDEVLLSYSAFPGNADVSKASLTGGLELGISNALSLQIDAGVNSFNLRDETGSSVAIHAIHHFDDALSIGGFYGVDRLAGTSTNVYGIEGGYKQLVFGVEGYVAQAENSRLSATVFGIEGTVATSEGFYIGASVDRIDFDGGSGLTRFGVTGNYQFSPYSGMYAEFGRVTGDAYGFSGSELYVGVGASFSLGANRGTTFGRRSV
ncbi:MAG: hypothetical protein WA784_05300, partial [Albidovulum sp.]